MSHLSQNFLIDNQILARTVAAARLTKTDTILEIGPGNGILTNALAPKVGKIIAIEFDGRLIPKLQNLTTHYPNLTVINADITKTNWRALVGDRYKIVANIPYHITGKIVRDIFQPGQSLPKLIVLMIQWEVAKKIVPRDDDHSVLSNLVRLFGQPEIITKVSRDAFKPAPAVDSALLAVYNIQLPDVADFDAFFRLIKIGFSSRRKTLTNNLSAGLHRSKPEIAQLLTNHDIDPTRRPQTLSLAEWKKLYYTLETN